MTTCTLRSLAAIMSFVLGAPVWAGPTVGDLLRDVVAIDSGGSPASIVVWNQAEALVVAPDGRVFAAAAEVDSGRVVVLGHGGFVQTDNADSEVFAANAVEWLAGKAARDGAIRVFGLSDTVAAELTRRGTSFQRVGGRPRGVVLDDVDVVVGSPQAFAKAQRLGALQKWLRRGGGMLVTETAWGVLQLNADLTIDTLAANRLLQSAGIRFTKDAHSAFGGNGDFPVDRDLLATANATTALAVLAGDADGDPVFAARVLGAALESVPLDATLMTDVQEVAGVHRVELDAIYGNLANERLTPKKHPLARALLDADARLAMETPPDRITVHASSVAFPGPVGPERADSAALELDTAVPGWHTTGLYAAPGEVVTVIVPEAVAQTGAVVQIGAWRDPHTHAHRVRLKNALRRFPIDAAITRVASAIGGPIYIDLSDGPDRAPTGDTLLVEIRGAAPAPHYEHGVTDLDEWRASIRHRAVPWAEIESDKLIFTVPSSAIRDVDRPDLVMEHWNKVHEAMQSLEPRTANHWADRPYRYVADVSVSWGYMYCPANGPIVIPVKAAAAMFQLENFDAEGENKLWGHYHEMGHAHQHPFWTDRTTGEVTVNIFTVYALHMVNGYPLDSDVMRTTLEKAWKTYESQRDSGKTFTEVGGAFPRLQFYALLWHHFGFEAFHEAFDAMRTVPGSERPRTDDDEHDLFLVTFSTVVGRDLAPYFDAWGVPVSDTARQHVAHLPAWLPDPPQATP